MQTTHAKALVGLNCGYAGAVPLTCGRCQRQALRCHLSAELVQLRLQNLGMLCLHTMTGSVSIAEGGQNPRSCSLQAPSFRHQELPNPALRPKNTSLSSLSY